MGIKAKMLGLLQEYLGVTDGVRGSGGRGRQGCRPVLVDTVRTRGRALPSEGARLALGRLLKGS